MPAKTLLLALTLALTLLLTCGCLTGLIYTNTTVPLDRNFDRTPVYSGSGGKVRHIHIPIPTFRIDFLWDSNAIGDIARKHGLKTVYYADLQERKILGIWNTYTVHVYGSQVPFPDVAEDKLQPQEETQ